MNPRRQIHLALSLGGNGPSAGWRHPASRVEDLASLDLAVDLAELAEAACFDAVFRPDGVSLDRSADTIETKEVLLDPTLLMSALAARTRSIGLISTVSTTFSQPYAVARQFATLDHLSRGRSGWNVVTSLAGAGSAGIDPLPAASDRYQRAQEFLDVTRSLWRGWTPDAVVADRAAGIYARSASVRATNHRGHHFSIDAALNLPRSPQTEPVIVQAGASEAGIDFAARNSEVVFIAAPDLEGARDYERRLTRRLTAHGRARGDVRILAGLVPFVAKVHAEAEEEFRRISDLTELPSSVQRLARNLEIAELVDLPPRSPLPAGLIDRRMNGGSELSSRARQMLLRAREEHLSTGELARLAQTGNGHRVQVGDPEGFADMIEQWVDTGAVDGFVLLSGSYTPLAHAFVELVVPLLRERGLFRSSYESSTLRGHLGLEKNHG